MTGPGDPRVFAIENDPLTLCAIRESVGLTQTETSIRAGMSQAEISRVERRNDHLVSTIRRYVAALGGTVEVFAVIDGRRVQVKGV